VQAGLAAPEWTGGQVLLQRWASVERENTSRHDEEATVLFFLLN
jgi:hypothetical protein